MQQDNNNILKIVKISIYKIPPHLPFQREEKYFPLLPSGSETALGRRPKGDEGGLDNFFQTAKLILKF